MKGGVTVMDEGGVTINRVRFGLCVSIFGLICILEGFIELTKTVNLRDCPCEGRKHLSS